MMPPRLGISRSKALFEAHANADSGEPELITLALYHPSFVDADGNDAAIYVVRDYEPLRATLEQDAPLSAGKEVTFLPVLFDITLPEESDTSQAPTVNITIDNASRELMPYLREASSSQTQIDVIVRIYMPSDTSAPHEDPPMRLVLRDVQCGVDTVSATSCNADLANLKFPSLLYTQDSHPGLAAR
jgi:hypothetical protein